MKLEEQIREIQKKGRHYEVHCGDFVFTCSTKESAEFHAKRIGLARCEEVKVIDPTGATIYEF